jgi:serine/threonine-protein kinase ATR
MHLLVPSASIMATLWPSASSLLVLPHGFQADIRDPIQAQIMAMDLISVLCGYASGETQHTPPSTPSENWQLDCCFRIVDLCAASADDATDQNDRIYASVAHLVNSGLESWCSKRKISPIIDLVISLLGCFIPQQHRDFGNALESILTHLLTVCPQKSKGRARLRQLLLPVVQRLINDIKQTSENVSNEFLHNFIDVLTRLSTSDGTTTRPVKRQKLDQEVSDPCTQLRAKLIIQITETLTGTARANLPELDTDAVSRLSECADVQRMSILTSIGRLPCVAAECLQASHSMNDKDRCRTCDSILWEERHRSKPFKVEEDGAKLCQRLLAYLSLCIEDVHLRRSRSFRVAAANAIRRISNHLDDSECLMLSWKGLGSWLLRSLQSSVRELRISSAEALVSYLREDLPESVRTRNRLDTLDFLKCLAEKNNLLDQETLTFAWGLIGRTCGDAELNLALIQLVDYLGHPHSLVSGAAYHEVLHLADFRGCTPLELLKPYWNSLATHVVKDIFACPQKVQQLADLLGLAVNDLLILTQTETVPFLVLTRKKDVLQRIAQARGASTTIQDLWLQPSKNLAAVLALLLVQPSEDSEHSAIALLKDASPSFAENELSALVKVDPILIACEILKHAGDCPDSKKAQAHQGLRLLAVINERKPSITKSNKSSKYLSAFLEAHILGIMSHFTDIIDAPVERQPLAEKRRALRAVEQLIIVGKGQVGIAIPQVSNSSAGIDREANNIPDTRYITICLKSPVSRGCGLLDVVGSHRCCRRGRSRVTH